MNDILPKEELLLKLLNMTTSNHDHEVLVAIRKANELLTANKWSWEKLLKNKIKVVEDPFKNLTTPGEGLFGTPKTSRGYGQWPAGSFSSPPPKPAPTPPRAAAPKPAAPPPRATRPKRQRGTLDDVLTDQDLRDLTF
jgi:hypothetical protein